MHRLLPLLFLTLIFQSVSGQVLPKEGSRLNYRLIGFSIPPSSGSINKYTIEIALGTYNSEDSFKQHVIKKIETTTNKVIAEVPSFGRQYTWRVIGDQFKSSRYNHFSTGTLPAVDTSQTRLRILKSAEKYKDAYVFMDGNKVLYDMNGQPVWYLPEIPGLNIESGTICDLKPTSWGTVTFLLGRDICEIDYDGNLLWRKQGINPETNDSPLYHHEFTRLANGHYMALGTAKKRVFHKLPGVIKGSVVVSQNEKGIDTAQYRGVDMMFGALFEYDANGREVWRWNSLKYFEHSDLKYHRPTHAMVNSGMHENSFFFDEDKKYIYISCKDINRIIKVSYPDGAVVSGYGEKFNAEEDPLKGENMGVKPDELQNPDRLFCGQHACKISPKGHLYLFNNNQCHPDHFPTIIFMEEPGDRKGSLKTIWEYECELDKEAIKDKSFPIFGTGGNLVELPDQSIFVCMGGNYAKDLIVSRDKKILWSAIMEKWDADEKKWKSVGEYRSSIVSDRKALERLIWKAATEKKL